MLSTFSLKSLKRRVRSPITLLKNLFLKKHSKKQTPQPRNVATTLDLPPTVPDTFSSGSLSSASAFSPGSLSSASAFSPGSLSSASSFSPATPVSFASTFDPAPLAHPFIDADLQYSLGDLGIMIDPGTPPAPPAKEAPVPRPLTKEAPPAPQAPASTESRVASKWRNQPRSAAVQKAPTKVEPVARDSVQADKSSTVANPIEVPAIVVPVVEISPPEAPSLDLPAPVVKIPVPEVPATEVAATIVPEPTPVLSDSLPAEIVTETQETVESVDNPVSIPVPVETCVPEPQSTLEDVSVPSLPASEPRPASLVLSSVTADDEPLISSPVDVCVQMSAPEHAADVSPPSNALRAVTEVSSPAPVLVESPVETVAHRAAGEARAADKEFGVLPAGRVPQPFTSRMPRRSSVASNKAPSLSRVPIATPPTLSNARPTRAASTTQDKDANALSELQASVRSREQRRIEREKREAAEKEREMQELREKAAAEKKIDLAELARKNTMADPDSVRTEVRSWRKQRESIMVLKSNTVDSVKAPAVREAMANTEIMTEVASAVESRSQRTFCDPREKRQTLLLNDLFPRPAARVGTA